MIKLQFTQKMLEVLQEIKTNKFISYEYENSSGLNMSYGKLRINLDKFSIDLSNEEKLFSFFDSNEEIAEFSCKKVDSKIPFKPIVNTETVIISVNEKIKSVEIISDEINVNNGEYEIIFDNALIIKTENQTIMFSKDVWFSEIINISNDDNYEKIYPLKTIIEDWNSEDMRNDVKVKRTKKIL